MCLPVFVLILKENCVSRNSEVDTSSLNLANTNNVDSDYLYLANMALPLRLLVYWKMYHLKFW